jgi:hypothetical protein
MFFKSISIPTTIATRYRNSSERIWMSLTPMEVLHRLTVSEIATQIWSDLDPTRRWLSAIIQGLLVNLTQSKELKSKYRLLYPLNPKFLLVTKSNKIAFSSKIWSKWFFRSSKATTRSSQNSKDNQKPQWRSSLLRARTKTWPFRICSSHSSKPTKTSTLPLTFKSN